MEILQLSKLYYLDLSQNTLKLQNPDLRSLVEKLTNMKKLFLSDVNISSALPNSFSNLTSLTSLFLTNCLLHGEFPTGIFRLPNLEDLRVLFNPDLTGYLPEFNRSSPLKLLKLTGTSFYGKLPDSIGNLKLLHDLEVGDCNFSGPLPPSLGNLTQLANLRLGENGFHGSIPSSIYRLVNLEVLYLNSNYFGGTVEFDLFSKLQNLHRFQLSYNHISLLTKLSNNITFSKFWILGLASCELNEFPDFLKNQNELEFLELSNNKFHGLIPKWMWNLSKETLWYLDLSYNFLTGFDQLPVRILVRTSCKDHFLSHHLPSKLTLSRITH